MTYTRATLEEFQAVFPPFAAVTEPQYAFWATRAERIVTDAFEDDHLFATELLTAHYLTLQGLGTGAEAEMAAQGAPGFTRIKSGTIELERGAATNASMGEYGSTAYGRQFWPLLRAYWAGPRVTDTGTLPRGGYPWPC